MISSIINALLIVKDLTLNININLISLKIIIILSSKRYIYAFNPIKNVEFLKFILYEVFLNKKFRNQLYYLILHIQLQLKLRLAIVEFSPRLGRRGPAVSPLNKKYQRT